MIDQREIEKLAKLSRLLISESEAKSLAKDIGQIIDYIGEIKKAGKIEKNNENLLLKQNVMREDDNADEPMIYSKKLTLAAPEREDQYFKVKKIL